MSRWFVWLVVWAVAALATALLDRPILFCISMAAWVVSLVKLVTTGARDLVKEYKERKDHERKR